MTKESQDSKTSKQQKEERTSFVMQNHFFFSPNVLLLFKEWKVDSVGVLVGAFVGVFFFTLIYEIARFYQSRFVNSDSVGPLGIGLITSVHNQDETGTYRYGTFGSGDVTSIPSSQNAAHAIPLGVRVRVACTPRYILSSLSFPLLVAANYFIMLAVMTYNAWLLVAVCLASGLAYFLLQSDHDAPAVKICNHDVIFTKPFSPENTLWSKFFACIVTLAFRIKASKFFCTCCRTQGQTTPLLPSSDEI